MSKIMQSIRSWFAPEAVTTGPRDDFPFQKQQPWSLGRFDPAPRADANDPEKVWHYGGNRTALEAAETTRLNEGHWSAASDRPINDELVDRLEVMRIRSNHEAWNNPSLEGLILSHTLAVVGEDGPMLDLNSETSEGDEWCDAAEQVWEEWCAVSDASGADSLGQRLKNWNRNGWTCGEWIDQLVTDDDARTPIQLRLLEIEPQRLATPFDWLNMADLDKVDQRVVLGIRRDKFRRPVEYAIHDSWSHSGSYKTLPARDVLHKFHRLETGQARGVPWANTGLPTAADLRDYDDQVMDAARAAADMGIIAWTENSDAGFKQPSSDVVSFKRRQMRHIAPGWKVSQMQAGQPTAQYKDHRHERMGDLGRGQGVPSMVIRLDAREHNFSSARFDYGLLHESAKHVRAKLYTPALNRLVDLVLREATLAGVLAPPPVRIMRQWIWPPMMSIDDNKTAMAESRAMLNGTLPFTEACKLRFRKPAQVIRQRQRDNEMLAKAGLAPIGAKPTTTT